MQSEARLRVIVECIAHEITVPDTFSVPLTGNETHEQMLKKCEEFC